MTKARTYVRAFSPARNGFERSMHNDNGKAGGDLRH